MGENIKENKYAIKDDGTIVRSRKCPKCGKELFSEGKYCEHCGSKIDSNTREKHKGNGWWKWLLLVLVFVGGGIALICTFYNDNYYNNSYYYSEECVDTIAVEELDVEEDEFDNNNYYNNDYYYSEE